MPYQVPTLAADFTADFENLVNTYLHAQWSISNPAKDTGTTGTDGTKVQFRPGFPNYSKPFEILTLTTSTVPANRNDPYSWHFFTTVEIRIVRSMELQRDNIAVELGNMEREVERIINSYTINGINGIQDFIFVNRNRDYGNVGGTATGAGSRVNTAKNWAASAWQSVTTATLSYYKELI